MKTFFNKSRIDTSLQKRMRVYQPINQQVYDLFCCQDCTKSLCLDIKKKMNVRKKLYLLVKTLNMNHDNAKMCYGVSTDFIRKK